MKYKVVVHLQDSGGPLEQWRLFGMRNETSIGRINFYREAGASFITPTRKEWDLQAIKDTHEDYLHREVGPARILYNENGKITGKTFFLNGCKITR